MILKTLKQVRPSIPIRIVTAPLVFLRDGRSKPVGVNEGMRVKMLLYLAPRYLQSRIFRSSLASAGTQDSTFYLLQMNTVWNTTRVRDSHTIRCNRFRWARIIEPVSK